MFLSMLKTKKQKNKKKKSRGPAETWTRIAGFKVQSANHYTTGPTTGAFTDGLTQVNVALFTFLK